jgi:hypothetical protein
VPGQRLGEFNDARYALSHTPIFRGRLGFSEPTGEDVRDNLFETLAGIIVGDIVKRRRQFDLLEG